MNILLFQLIYTQPQDLCKEILRVRLLTARTILLSYHYMEEVRILSRRNEKKCREFLGQIVSKPNAFRHFITGAFPLKAGLAK